MIVGFNDHYSTEGCKWVKDYGPYMSTRAETLRKEASDTKDPKLKRKLEGKARKFQSRGDAVAKRFSEIGCAKKGVFYVRDSIYPNKDMPKYDYDLNKEGEEEHLNAPVILREYEWLTTTANHVFQILPVRN